MKNTVALFKGRPFSPNSPDANEAYWPPLPTLSLAGPLRQAGFRVLMLDYRQSVEENWQILKEHLDDVLCLGISAQTGYEVHEGLAMIDALKAARTDIPVVWGGWHACVLAAETLADPGVDIVVAGLGQKAVVRIAQRLQAGVRHFSDIPYTTAKPEWDRDPPPAGEAKLDAMDLSEVELPAYDLLDLDYVRADSLLTIRQPVARNLTITGKINYVTSFGCPFHCTYCCNPEVFGPAWAGYPVPKVVAQLKWLNERGFNYVEFIDAELLARWHRVKELTQGIIDAGIPLRWASQATVKAIIALDRRGLMPLLVESGCFALNVGAESGSANILDYVRKRQSFEDILHAARILDKYEIEASFNCLAGFPKREGLDDIIETFGLAFAIKKINSHFMFPISFYTPLPGSAMYADCLEAGFKPPLSLREWGAYDPTYRTQAGSLPWRNVAMEKLVYLVLTFFLPLAVPGNIHRGTITHLKHHLETHPLRGLIWVGHKLAYWRMTRSFYGFPVEQSLFRLWRWLSGKREYVPGMRVENTVIRDDTTGGANPVPVGKLP